MPDSDIIWCEPISTTCIPTLKTCFFLRCVLTWSVTLGPIPDKIIWTGTCWSSMRRRSWWPYTGRGGSQWSVTGRRRSQYLWLWLCIHELTDQKTSWHILAGIFVHLVTLMLCDFIAVLLRHSVTVLLWEMLAGLQWYSYTALLWHLILPWELMTVLLVS